MRWTKLRQIAESRVAPSLAGRVRLESTHYRKAHDREGRVGIVLDGAQVWGRGCIEGDRSTKEVFTEMRQHGLSAGVANAWHEYVVRGAGLHNQYAFHSAVWDYTQLSVDDALVSPDAVIRALAYLDKRTGKRRLRDLASEPPRTQVERACLRARLESEGLAFEWPGT